ncbi:hypothetical protein ACFOLD_09215 [Kocuria carniphila]|uniref:hypothetical protein n=1 Tax=Kocuria carniphila TaxID=262208 RepID=UPI00360BC67A
MPPWTNMRFIEWALLASTALSIGLLRTRPWVHAAFRLRNCPDLGHHHGPIPSRPSS